MSMGVHHLYHLDLCADDEDHQQEIGNSRQLIAGRRQMSYASATFTSIQICVDAREMEGTAGVQDTTYARSTTCPGLGIGSNCHWRTKSLPASAIYVSAGVHFSLYARGRLPPIYYPRSRGFTPSSTYFLVKTQNSVQQANSLNKISMQTIESSSLRQNKTSR